MSHARRVVKNTWILYARMAITLGLSLYTTRLVLQALGAYDFGVFNLVAGTIAMFTFLNNSMTTTTQRFMSFAHGQKDELRQRQVFSVSVVLHIVIALLVFAILEAVGLVLFNSFFNIKSDRLYASMLVYQFAIATTFISIVTVPYDAVINARENMIVFAVIGIIDAVLKLVIVIIVSNAGVDKLVIYAELMAMLTIILLLFRIVLCYSRYEECVFNIKIYFDKLVFKELISFAVWTIFSCSSSMFTYYGQGLVINMFFGASVNAAHGIVNQVSSQLSMLATTMLKAVNPLIAKSAGAGDHVLMLKTVLTGGKVGFFLLVLFYVPVLIEMPYLFEIWLKQVPEYTIIFCRLLLINRLIDQLYSTLMSSISAAGDIKRFEITYGLINITPIPVIFLLFSYGYQPYFMYFILIFYSVILFFVVVFFACKLCFLDLNLYFYLSNVVFRCIFVFSASLGFGFLSLYFVNTQLIELVFVIIFSAIAFLISVWTVGFSDEERRWIKNNINLSIKWF